MLTLLAVVHVLIGMSLILFVLLQDPKGGAMGVFSGGASSNSFFGSTGASNFLTTTTKWLAIAFAASSLTLTYMTAKKGGSVMDGFTPPPAASPATPDAAAAPAATPAADTPATTPPPVEAK
jgi:preprotein translocase subunit SecG